MRQFLMGNEVLARAARDAGAKLMFGYPITPSSEILETWAKFCQRDRSLAFLQTEDEEAAGFAMAGACLAGVPAFTATAGPGNVLMQDAFSLAEALRLPTVAMIIQRGGLSTSTVIYSQEEVTLTCFGGNGEGFRIVYSTANLAELYSFTLKAFRVAWQYRWPTFILADGYQGKMKGEINISSKFPPKARLAKGGKVQSSKLFKPLLKKGVNLRNCYNLEEEMGGLINQYQREYEKTRPEIEEFGEYETRDAKIILLAHGIVAGAAKEAVKELRKKGIKIGLFRPITLRPFPALAARRILEKAEKIISLESALGQLAKLSKNELYGINVPFIEINKPAVGFSPEEITKAIEKYYI